MSRGAGMYMIISRFRSISVKMIAIDQNAPKIATFFISAIDETPITMMPIASATMPRKPGIRSSAIDSTTASSLFPFRRSYSS